jgi:hypothetical protein
MIAKADGLYLPLQGGGRPRSGRVGVFSFHKQDPHRLAALATSPLQGEERIIAP